MNGTDLVDRYLADLASAAADLPPTRRAELLDDVREHIASALEVGDPFDRVSVRNVLERLGSPAEIVAAEWTAAGTAPERVAAAARGRSLPPAPPSALPPAPPPAPAVAAASPSEPVTRRPRPFPVGLVGLVGLMAVGATITMQDGPELGAQVVLLSSPIAVLLLLYDVYRSRAWNSRDRRPVAPETMGFLAVVAVLVGILVAGGPWLAATTSLIFLPVLGLLLVTSALRGRRA